MAESGKMESNKANGGAAKRHKNKASRHFIWQRLTGLALIPLAVFFIASLLAQFDASHASASAYLGHPLIAITMLVLVFTAIWHMRLGMENIIYDYAHSTAARRLWLVLNRLFTLLIALACFWAILKLALT